MSFYLIGAIETLPEAIRFDFVLDFMNVHYENGEKPGALMSEITVKWFEISAHIIALIEKVKPARVHIRGRELPVQEMQKYIGHGVLLNKFEGKDFNF